MNDRAEGRPTTGPLVCDWRRACRVLHLAGVTVFAFPAPGGRV